MTWIVNAELARLQSRLFGLMACALYDSVLCAEKSLALMVRVQGALSGLKCSARVVDYFLRWISHGLLRRGCGRSTG